MAKRKYVSIAQRRTARQARAGLALIAACALLLAGALYGAYKIDQSRGISVSQSLRANGL